VKGSVILRIDDLTFYYPKRDLPALRSVSLEVAAGEFVLVAGPSGSGKSTLLRCLNGLIPHFSGGHISGSVDVAGFDVLRSDPRLLSESIGFVFQNPESQAVLETVEEDIAFVLENAAVPRVEMRERVNDILELLDIEHLRNRSLDTLSGGERQRVAIATAMVNQPTILALDEPTSQLDPEAALDVLQAVEKINIDRATTILLVEHRLDRIAQFAHRLVYLEDGCISRDESIDRTRDAINLNSTQKSVKSGSSTGHSSTSNRDRSNSSRTPLNYQMDGNGQLNSSSQSSAVMLAIEANDLVFAYDKGNILNRTQLRLSAGEITALIGRNGCGKSTLLKCLVGLLRPDTGEIRINGRSNAGRKIADICREAAYLPQAPDDLLFADSVADELAITLNNHGLQPADLAISPQDLLKALHLTEHSDRYPRDLSTGERQRVALASIVITAPNILLLDEPTRGLDPAAKQKLIDLLIHWRNEGKAILLATHDMQLVSSITDRVLILEDGLVSEAGRLLSPSVDSLMFVQNKSYQKSINTAQS